MIVNILISIEQKKNRKEERKKQKRAAERVDIHRLLLRVCQVTQKLFPIVCCFFLNIISSLRSTLFSSTHPESPSMSTTTLHL